MGLLLSMVDIVVVPVPLAPMTAPLLMYMDPLLTMVTSLSMVMVPYYDEESSGSSTGSSSTSRRDEPSSNNSNNSKDTSSTTAATTTDDETPAPPPSSSGTNEENDDDEEENDDDSQPGMNTNAIILTGGISVATLALVVLAGVTCILGCITWPQ
jgi:cobalamin biosynthesis Mg chelatase CobN